jgi:gluconokinase
MLAMATFILMGVSGSGKSTIGRCVAQALSLPFIEGDEYHTPANIIKMASGIALDDVDRLAWIDALMQAINARPENDVIVACSALTRSVRTHIQTQSRRAVVFLHLTTDPAVIEQRLRTRSEHFMKAGMLPSQLSALQTDMVTIPIDAAPPVFEVCAAVQAQVVPRLSQSSAAGSSPEDIGRP